MTLRVPMIARTWLLLVAALCPSGPAAAQSTTLILSTTTSTQDSGLLDALVPLFERKTGVQRQDSLRRHRPGAGPRRPGRG